MVKTKLPLPEIGTVVMVNGDLPLSALQSAYDHGIVAVDTETTGLDPRTSKLALVQVRVGDTTYLIRDIRQPLRLYTLIASSYVTKVFHNAAFDLSMFYALRFQLGVRNVADTYVAVKLLDPEKKQITSFSLRNLVKLYFDHDLDKSLQVSQWDQELTPEQQQYAAEDVRFLIPLLHAIECAMPAESLPYLYSQYRAVPRHARGRLQGA